MALTSLLTVLSLIYFTNASQADFIFQAGSCSALERPSLVNVSQIVDGHFKQENTTPKPIKQWVKPSWTRKTQCLVDENTRDSYCVYISENFANGRGISFFTTPKIAKKIIKTPAFTQPGIHNDVNDFSDAPWEIKWLPDESRKIFMKTATHNPGDPIMERINTNAFAGEFEGEQHFFLYPETALMNHDCRPNAMYDHNTSTFVHAAHASRTIHKGEEITITYINLLQPTHERRETLEMIWGFNCKCSLCSSGAAATKRSDYNIQKITELHQTLSDWTATSTATPAQAEDLLELYEKEHLHAAIGTGHMFASYAYNSIGNVGMAIKHAKLALEAGMKMVLEKVQGVIFGYNYIDEKYCVNRNRFRCMDWRPKI
ncbi:putative N-lysine methyltransferase SMYD2 [Halenospora varia]|nr:putative N-lysine methyltransferase SMYD2 [Halenospora varia]